jgi:hypothetical protein
MFTIRTDNLWDDDYFLNYSEFQKVLFLASGVALGIGSVEGIYAKFYYCSIDLENAKAYYIGYLPKDGLGDFFSSDEERLVKLVVSLDGSYNIEIPNSVLNSDYTLSIDNLTDTALQEALAAIQNGQKVSLCIAPDFPGYKIPLVWLDENAGMAWFSTEMVADNTAYTVFVSLSIDGIPITYIKNPTTGELILQE